ncbi:MAG: ribonuclease HII [Kiritimatiellae bacterium]|jgi:ribonuclease HII|nr:ribonuclease HII [Kiritimatiellia bacterium]
MLTYENKLWKANSSLIIAGVDEAGRGCLAGPVVAGAVSMSVSTASALYAGELSGLTDSKKLTPVKREHFFELLSGNSEVHAASGWCSSEEVDTLNVLCATHLAMRRALENISVKVSHALIDGLPVKGLPCPSTAIVKGDSKSFLIAAASIIAKVSRDHYMMEMDKEFPDYGFAAHKGYGTHVHVAALHKYGSCLIHRHTFRPVQDVEQSLPGFEWE